MVVYLYKWKLIPSKEKQFIEAWSYVTKELRTNCRSLGSRLHKGDDGLYYGYAQWPDRDTRDQANLNHPEIDAARKQMKDAIEQSYPDIVLNPTADFLIHPG